MKDQVSRLPQQQVQIAVGDLLLSMEVATGREFQVCLSEGKKCYFNDYF